MNRLYTLLSILIASFIAVSAYAAEGIGSWHVFGHFGGKPQRIVDTGKIVYYLSGGSLFSYEPSAGESKCYTYGDFLHGNCIDDIFYNQPGKYLVICYDNGAIDVLHDSGDIDYISDIADSGVSGKVSFNDVEFEGNSFYTATDFGIVKFDVGNRRAVKSGVYRRNVSGVALVDGNLLMVVDDTLRIAAGKDDFHRLALTSPLGRVGSAAIHASGGDSLLVYDGTVSVIRIIDNVAVDCGKISDSVIDGMIVNGDRISYYGNGRLFAYNPSAGQRLIASLPAGMEKDKVGFADNGKGYVWLLSREGVASCHIDADGREEISTGRFKPSGMSVTKACSLIPSADGRRLYCINHGPTSYRYGYPEGYNGYDIPAEIACVDMENDNTVDITPYPVEALSDITASLQNGYGPYPFAVTSVAEHPDDDGICFAGTGNDGLYMLRNGKFAGRYSSENSPLRPVWGWIVYSVGFDRSGNLWVVSNHDNYTDCALMILPRDKTALDPSMVKPSDWIVPESDGYFGDMDSKILVCRRSPMVFIIDKLKPQILLACDTRQADGDASRYRFRLFDELVDQDGNPLSDCVVSAITEDRDGSVWIGTLDKGIYRLTGVDKAIDGEMRVQHVKVPRKDGSGLADYLLAYEQINDISVDSSGRKWIATERSGLFVVSPDGSEIIMNYNTGNAPMASNTVYNVYAQPSGRKIYVATPEGVLMHVSDMAPDSGSIESLHIYPNPVRPDHMGDVMIDGLTEGSVVTISSLSGNIVGRGRAEGGTFRWSPPASLVAGIYYVTAASPSGASAVGKLVVIK